MVSKREECCQFKKATHVRAHARMQTHRLCILNRVKKKFLRKSFPSLIEEFVKHLKFRISVIFCPVFKLRKS
jgi:hypothetical protein